MKTAQKWTAGALMTAAIAVAGFWWSPQWLGDFNGSEAVEIKVIDSAWTWEDGVRTAVRLPPDCPAGGWRAKGTEAGYLLAVDIDSGVLDPQGDLGWFDQIQWSDTSWLLNEGPDGSTPGAGWFARVYPLITPAIGAVWVSEGDLESAYQIDGLINSVDVDDAVSVAMIDTVTEATGHRLHPVWRVTCHWEPPPLEMPEALRLELQRRGLP